MPTPRETIDKYALPQSDDQEWLVQWCRKHGHDYTLETTEQLGRVSVISVPSLALYNASPADMNLHRLVERLKDAQ